MRQRSPIRFIVWLAAGLLTFALIRVAPAADDATPRFDQQIVPLLKTHCVKCHGPAKRQGGLNLSTPAGIARGGKKGAVVAPHDLKASRLWERVENDEMPPEEPLSAAEKALLKRWILGGAPGLSPMSAGANAEGDHWAFQRLVRPQPPIVRNAARASSDIDRFVQAELEQAGLTLRPEAGRATLIRRVSFDLTGLPPSLEELDEFLADRSPAWYSRMIERYLASPHYGERWGKYWLDAAGYADSNGYFSADSERPLAYRYRDYVVRSFNQDRPFNQFIREQLAGDELAGFVAGQPATPDVIELLEATHYLRNGQDGTGESDGNPDEVRVDRYAALESAMQNVSASLLGLTIQCAKCHNHKFEPITQRDYYRFQAVFFPAFNIEKWVKPNDRVVHAPLPGEQERWERETRELDAQVRRLRSEFADWVRANRRKGDILFEDTFDSADARLATLWSATAPGDDAPGGALPVNLDSDTPPAARLRDGHLVIIEGAQGDSWLSTRKAFDWTPADVGESIQATFDLVDNKLPPDGKAAERIGYFIALHDFNDNSAVAGGNLLIDGNPGGSTSVYLDYPGADSRSPGVIGTTGYIPGRNYGVRITNLGDGKYRLEHLVDGVPEEKSLTLAAADLPDGGFGFEYCCGRSFVVDNVIVERFPATKAGDDSDLAKFRGELKTRQDALAAAVARQRELTGRKPGRIAWLTDLSPTPPEVHLLERGNYSTPGPTVNAAPLSALADSTAPPDFGPPPPDARTTGRRLAWATWVTQPDSRAAALVARVQVNRIWQQHFGRGIVTTPENLGLSGAPPSHPELLDWLASEFAGSESQGIVAGDQNPKSEIRNPKSTPNPKSADWSIKSLHRVIMNSATYRQSSVFSQAAHQVDPDNSLLWRYPVQRLDAEAIRDAMLAASGDLDRQAGGPFVPTSRNGAGEIVVPETAAGARRRSLYLLQRRTQVLSFLAVFDAPSIVFNSVRRPQSTMPLQSLSLLNSDFAVARARGLAARLERLQPDETRRLNLAYRLTLSREPTADEATAAIEFLDTQSKEYAGQSDARRHAWRDLCQSLMSSNEFLYVE